MLSVCFFMRLNDFLLFFPYIYIYIYIPMICQDFHFQWFARLFEVTSDETPEAHQQTSNSPRVSTINPAAPRMLHDLPKHFLFLWKTIGDGNMTSQTGPPTNLSVFVVLLLCFCIFVYFRLINCLIWLSILFSANSLHFLLINGMFARYWMVLSNIGWYSMVLDYRESLKALRVVVAVAWQGPFLFKHPTPPGSSLRYGNFEKQVKPLKIIGNPVVLCEVVAVASQGPVSPQKTHPCPLG